MNDEIIEITRSGYESLQREVESLRGELELRNSEIHAIIATAKRVQSQSDAAIQKAKEALHRCRMKEPGLFAEISDALQSIKECGA